MNLFSLSILLLSTTTTALVPTQWNGQTYGCKCYVDDSCWPTAQQWSALNVSTGGNLVVDVPPGAVCHDTFQGPLGTIDTYDAVECTNVSSSFSGEQWT